MKITPLEDAQILIGKATDPQELRGKIDDIPGLEPFKANCPLWTYTLAEAFDHQEDMPVPVTGNGSTPTPKLGPVGGRIVAEVFLGLMFGDNNSLLNLDPDWTPALSQDFRLKDLVTFALGH
jgi:hypothetical protein